MEYRTLGQTGITVSALGFGCGAIGGLMTKGDAHEQRLAVAQAFEAGITYFDTAPSYGNGASETNLGRVLAELGLHDKVKVGTKVRLAPDDLPRAMEAIDSSVEASLRRLGRDHVDLLQLHTPVAAVADGRGLPVDEVLNGVSAADAAYQGARQSAPSGLHRVG